MPSGGGREALSPGPIHKLGAISSKLFQPVRGQKTADLSGAAIRLRTAYTDGTCAIRMQITQERWIPTPRAAMALGLSISTLKRWIDEGYFQPGVHFIQAPFELPQRWNVEAVEALTSSRISEAAGVGMRSYHPGDRVEVDVHSGRVGPLWVPAFVTHPTDAKYGWTTADPELQPPRHRPWTWLEQTKSVGGRHER